MQDELEKIKDQIIQYGRDISRLDSEDGTVNRRMDRLNESMFRIEKDLREIIFGNGKTGMVVEIDRLKEDNKRLKLLSEQQQQEIKALHEYKTEQKGSIRVAMWFIGIGVAILVGIVITLATR